MTELSPAAQTVFDATFPVYDDEILYVAPARKHASMIAAAALRAAALYCKRDKLILLSLADELEA